MNTARIRSLMDELGLSPNKALGQNFLCDGNLLRAIVRDAAPAPGESILEIGAGTGVLTAGLLAAGCQVTAVEIDHRLHEHLGIRFGDSPRLRLVRADACRLDYDELMGSAPYRCVANLPYSVSTVVLTRLCEAANPPTALLILLQREMAERLTARPSSKAYGGLTVQTSLLYEAHLLRRVPPEVFLPPPAVESALLRLTRRSDAAPAAERRLAGDVARLAFGQRRKRLGRTLASRYGAERVGAALQRLGLDPNVRPEELAPERFIELARLL